MKKPNSKQRTGILASTAAFILVVGFASLFIGLGVLPFIWGIISGLLVYQMVISSSAEGEK